MKTYQVIRTDTYLFTVEAKSIKEARTIVTTDDRYLNEGGYNGSEFKVIQWGY